MIEQVCLLRMIKFFIYPTVSSGSLGKGVMLIPLALGDAQLNKNLERLDKVFMQPNVSYGSLVEKRYADYL